MMKYWNRNIILICMLLGFTLSITAQTKVRFAVLTDIHLREGESTPTQDLINSVNQINHTDSIDFILVTGDIADEGDHASLLNAKKELDKLIRPYYIVMGNHDTKWSESGCT